jgi:CHASE2 domain-containing sensor protein
MAVAGWFDRSFANSFTLCLICLICMACAARVAVGYAFFIPYVPGVADGSAGVE